MIRSEAEAQQGSHGRRPLFLIKLGMRADLACRGRIRAYHRHPDAAGLFYLLPMMTPVIFYLVAPAVITSDDKGGLIPVGRHRLQRIPQVCDRQTLPASASHPG